MNISPIDIQQQQFKGKMFGGLDPEDVDAFLQLVAADLKADTILADANRKLADLKSQIQDLRREKIQFETALKSLLDTHYKMLTLNDE